MFSEKVKFSPTGHGRHYELCPKKESSWGPMAGAFFSGVTRRYLQQPGKIISAS